MQANLRNGSHQARLLQLIGVLAIVSLAAVSPVANSDTAVSMEAQVKAAIVVKLANFVDWPQTKVAPSKPLTLCLLGETPLAAAFASKEVAIGRDHALKVVPLPSATDELLAGCQILFVGISERSAGDTVLRRLASNPILTISDTPGFAKRGGMVELVKSSGRVGFMINLGMAKKAGITISSQVLEMATLIE